MKNKEAKKFAIEKALIEALIGKHRPCTPKTPDDMSRCQSCWSRGDRKGKTPI